MGGGTGENVALMSEYMDLNLFHHIYVVDLCPSLCKQVTWSEKTGRAT